MPNKVEQAVKGYQRLASPIAADLTEQTMLNRIPLGGSRWIVTHRNHQAISIDSNSRFGIVRCPSTNPWAQKTGLRIVDQASVSQNEAGGSSQIEKRPWYSQGEHDRSLERCVLTVIRGCSQA